MAAVRTLVAHWELHRLLKSPHRYYPEINQICKWNRISCLFFFWNWQLSKLEMKSFFHFWNWQFSKFVMKSFFFFLFLKLTIKTIWEKSVNFNYSRYLFTEVSGLMCMIVILIYRENLATKRKIHIDPWIISVNVINPLWFETDFSY
jgi:hypothetical protein